MPAKRPAPVPVKSAGKLPMPMKGHMMPDGRMMPDSAMPKLPARGMPAKGGKKR